MPAKAVKPIDVTEFGIVRDVRPEFRKALWLIDVRVEPGAKFIDKRLKVASTDAKSIIVTELGISIEVILERKNANGPIDVTPKGITTAPAHRSPLETTSLVIVKVGVTAEARPVKQLYVPSGSPTAFAVGALMPDRSVAAIRAMRILWKRGKLTPTLCEWINKARMELPLLGLSADESASTQRDARGA